YNHPEHHVIFELDEPYHLDYAYIYYNEPSQLVFRIYTSLNGSDWNQVGNGAYTLSTNWHKVDFNKLYCGGIKYVKLGIQDDEKIFNGIVLYGRKATEAIIKGSKRKRFINKRTLANTI